VAPLFPGGSFFLIAGPCVLEDDDLNLRVARQLVLLQSVVPGPVIFKASFDKANRSNKASPRGPGLEAGLNALRRIKEATGLPLLTDVHLPEQCAPVAEVVDCLQIPAFLCRQTDLLLAAGATGRAVNVKKGQWMTPEAMSGAVAKVRAAGGAAHNMTPDLIPEVAVTERGTFFGYGDLVVDMRSIAVLQESCSASVIFDATHSVQKPGMGTDGTSGGEPRFIPLLAAAAVAAGANGVFVETHPEPSAAPSDGSNMLPLASLERFVRRLVRTWEAAQQ
jgi:2-dehydro-3-deoxyphosphooctonate aldolase (KDO 8-P synthase)